MEWNSEFRRVEWTMRSERNGDKLVLSLAQVSQGVDNLVPEDILPLLSQVAALQSALAARLLDAQGYSETSPTEDRLITVAEAAERLGTTPDWLYRNADDLPFTVRLAPRQLRFSAHGIERYLHTRQGQR
jgi:predicted DNA-binding transcriptional regulator AlpA